MSTTSTALMTAEELMDIFRPIFARWNRSIRTYNEPFPVSSSRPGR